MGQDRSIINEEFKEQEEIDTHQSLKHKSKNYARKRKELKVKGKKSSNLGKKRDLRI
jgi:hypothetical protein